MPHTPPFSPAAIFFDLDDTLIDDHAASSAGLRRLMRELGHPDFAAARRLWDVQTEISFGAYLAGRLTLDQQRRERVRALATQAGHGDMEDRHCDALYQGYLEGHRSGWRLFDDAASTLERLSAAGVALGVITNGAEAMQREKLGALGIADRFGVLVCADSPHVGCAKPDPRIFHLACRELDLPAQRCWHVGDQLRSDVLGAVNAGLHPVLLDQGRSHSGSGDGASRMSVITELGELPDLLGAPVRSGPGW